MKTDKVFTIFNKKGEEFLVYIKDRNTIINLLSEENETMDISELDFNSLKIFNKEMYLFSFMTKKCIQKAYLRDRKSLIDIRNTFICEKVSLTEAYHRFTGRYGETITYYWAKKFLEYGIYTYQDSEKILFIDNYILKYKDIFDGKEYFGFKAYNDEGIYKIDEIFHPGGEYLFTKNIETSEVFKSPYEEKGEVIKLLYKLNNHRREK